MNTSWLRASRIARLDHAALLGALGLVLGSTACSSSEERVRSFDFGPYEVTPQQETTKHCVQISLDNADPLFISAVELTTGAGFHHSNWLYVPEDVFAGPDGTFDCDERGYSEALAAAFGGVLFAQSTQKAHEVQQFSPGVAIRLPPRQKIVAQLHLLNASDRTLKLTPNLKLTSIAEEQVQISLAGISFQNQALGLPAGRQSRFSVECDLTEKHQKELGRAPDFNIYYALAHYHELGTGLSLDAVRADGSSVNIYTTANAVGDSLGGPIDPVFNMSGFTKLRMSCEFYNPRSQVVRWGIGDQEMCVFLAFSDSERQWAGGVTSRGAPANETLVGNTLQYSNPCTLFALPTH